MPKRQRYAAAPRRRLGMELRRLRDISKLSCEDVASEIECNKSTISRVETGETNVRKTDFRYMLDLYRVSTEVRERLTALYRKTRQPAWWQAYRVELSEHFSVYVELEAEACSIQTYEPIYVPGLLQTEGYMRACAQSFRPKRTDDEIDQRVALRVERQKILKRPDGPQYWAILDEAVLHRVVGEREVMREQLEHLIEMSKLPNITIQVVDRAAGAYSGMGLAFVVLRLPDEDGTQMAYTDSISGGFCLDDPTDIEKCSAAFDHHRAVALADDASQAIIRQAVRAL